jgi:hypothetical protein
MGKLENKTDKTWAELNEAAKDMSEKEALEALEHEKNGKRRKAYMLRLYGRYSATRSQREREAIVAWALHPTHGGH